MKAADQSETFREGVEEMREIVANSGVNINSMTIKGSTYCARKGTGKERMANMALKAPSGRNK